MYKHWSKQCLSLLLWTYKNYNTKCTSNNTKCTTHTVYLCSGRILKSSSTKSISHNGSICREANSNIIIGEWKIKDVDQLDVMVIKQARFLFSEERNAKNYAFIHVVDCMFLFSFLSHSTHKSKLKLQISTYKWTFETLNWALWT